MTKLFNGTALIHNYLDRNIDIKRVLTREIVNNHSLAQHILKENPDLKMSVRGVVSAIRRYSESMDITKSKSTIFNILAQTHLSMSYDYGILRLHKAEKSIAAITEIFRRIQLAYEDNIHIYVTKSEFSLIFDNKHFPTIKSLLPSDMIFSEEHDIGMISLKHGPEILRTPNVYALVINEIGINGINIIEAVTQDSNEYLFVKEKDLLKTCDILRNLVNSAKRQVCTIS